MAKRNRQTRESKRYASLALQIQDIRGYSLRATSVLLGISQPQLTRIIGGDREGIGAEKINLARERVGLDPAYFFDDYDGETDYRSYIEPLYNDLRLLLLRNLDIDSHTPDKFNLAVKYCIEAADLISRWLNRDIARMNAIKDAAEVNKKVKTQYIRLLSQNRTNLYQQVLRNSSEGMELAILVSQANFTEEGPERLLDVETIKEVYRYLRFEQRLVEQILVLIKDDPDLSSLDMFPIKRPALK